jgi:hypothetical protein
MLIYHPRESFFAFTSLGCVVDEYFGALATLSDGLVRTEVSGARVDLNNRSERTKLSP